MVSFPKQITTHCAARGCKKHTKHKVLQYKAGQRRDVAAGQRRYIRKQKGYGGQTRPIFRKKAKTTKKIVIKLQCSTCKRIHQVCIGRAKHFDIGMGKKA